jgi:hypothetical protein
LLVLATPTGGAAEPDLTEVYPRLIARYGDAIVRLKFVSSFRMGDNEQKQPGQAVALAVSADGLLLVSDQVVSPQIPKMAGANMPEFEVNAAEFKVRLGSGDEEIPARLVTRDSDLGLAWFKMERVPERFAHVDLDASVELKAGSVYFSVTRSAETFGAVPIVAHGVIVGATEAPVPALLALGPMDAAFDEHGKFAGFVVRNFNLDGVMGLYTSGVIPQPMIRAERVAKATEQAADLAAAGADAKP